MKRWFASIADSHVRVITVLFLVTPLFALALIRDLDRVDLAGLPGLYAGLTIFG